MSGQFRHFVGQWPEGVGHYVYNRFFRNGGDPVDELAYLSKQAAITSHISKQFPMCMPDLQQVNAHYVKQFIGQMTNIN